MDEIHRQIGGEFVAVADAQTAVAGKAADDGHFDVVDRADVAQPGQVGLRRGDDHAFLRLAEPDFPRAQAGVFERDVAQIHVHTHILAHFADGRGEPARAAVGNGGVQALVPRHDERVEHSLLGDRIADLHDAANGLAGVVRQFGGGERRAMETVAARAPAQRHAQIARLRRRAVNAARRNAHAAAVDQRVGDVVRVIQNRAVDGGDAHLVAVILDARHDAARDTARVERAAGHVRVRHIERTETQHVRVGDGLRGNAHHVADHAADARVRPTERLQRRGVVVCLHLERHLVFVVERHDAGVVHERREYPRLVQRLRRRPQVGLDKARNDFSRTRINTEGHGFFFRIFPCLSVKIRVQYHPRHAAVAGIVDFGFEGLVLAMFRPGLGQDFQFDVGGIAVQRLKFSLNRPHLREGEEQHALDAQPLQGFIIQTADRDDVHSIARCGVRHEFGLHRPHGVRLDHGIAEQFFRNAVQLGRGDIAFKGIARAGDDGFERADTQLSRAVQQVFGDGVGDAGVKSNFDGAPPPLSPPHGEGGFFFPPCGEGGFFFPPCGEGGFFFPPCGEGGFFFPPCGGDRGGEPTVALDDRIDQELDGDALYAFCGKCTPEKVEVADVDLRYTAEAQMNNLVVDIHGAPIFLAMPKNFDAISVCHNLPPGCEDSDQLSAISKAAQA